MPLAGVTAYFASRPLVESKLLRAWASVAYAFLPAATGALATGRLGTAVLAVLLPLIARAAVAAYGIRAEPKEGAAGAARGSWRATWAYTFLLTLAMAFTPIVWPIALVLGLAVLALRRDDIVAYGLRLLAVVGTPLLVLAPWSLSLLTSPSNLFHEAGLEFGTGQATALDLLGMSPGGPKAAGGVLLIGVVLAALAALLRGERQFAVRAAWVTALVALVFAVLANNSGWAAPPRSCTASRSSRPPSSAPTAPGNASRARASAGASPSPRSSPSRPGRPRCSPRAAGCSVARRARWSGATRCRYRRSSPRRASPVTSRAH